MNGGSRGREAIITAYFRRIADILAVTEDAGEFAEMLLLLFMIEAMFCVLELEGGARIAVVFFPFLACWGIMQKNVEKTKKTA